MKTPEHVFLIHPNFLSNTISRNSRCKQKCMLNSESEHLHRLPFGDVIFVLRFGVGVYLSRDATMAYKRP